MEKKATTVELILLPYLMLQCDIVCLHSLTTMLWLLSSNDSIPLVSLSTRAGVVYSYGQSYLHLLHPSLQPGNAHGAAIHSEDIRL